MEQHQKYSFKKIFLYSLVPMSIVSIYFLYFLIWWSPIAILLFLTSAVLSSLFISVIVYYKKIFVPVWVILFLWVLLSLFAPVIFHISQGIYPVFYWESLIEWDFFILTFVLVVAFFVRRKFY